MTTAGGAGAPGQRIGTAELVRGAVARMRQGGWPIFGLLLAFAATTTAVSVIAGPAVGLRSAADTQGYLAYTAAHGILGGLFAGLSMRLMLEGPRDWLRIDRSLLECSGWIAAVTIGVGAVGVLMGDSAQTMAAAEADPFGSLLRSLALLVGWIVGVYVLLKLTLWPVGLLMGRADLTPARSWRLMRGAGRGLVLGYVVFMIPLIPVLALAMPAFVADGAWRLGPSTVAMNLASAAFTLAGYAMVTVIYERRVDEPTTVADVFD